ncbi:hypothetical protein BT96DRAFT_1027191 [Gymnopus androsaceus JB14]|uniref:DUF6534 domain-containing protein n=1 Tax=Gymnopus androsaceus JB14 TaxID=1447944 RepID=A0A6A4GD66_9AGAR|nr:hypothetical protein BT96DRAFT_1027191 [Gymnopus androsaceus JB14]
MVDLITDTTSGAHIPALDNTMGALLVGILFSSALWGISAAQTYIYFDTFYNQDTLRLKLLVVFIFGLDTAHQIMLCHLIYVYLVSNFGNPNYLALVVWSILVRHYILFIRMNTLTPFKVMVILSAIIAATIQLFMCWRIWILSNKSVYWIIPLVVVVLASFVITVVYFVRSWSLRTWVELADLSKISRAVNGLNFGGDIVITFAMVYLLDTSKTNALMNRLMYFCLATGLLTTVCAICSLVSISVWPNTFVYIGFYVVLARLYVNSFLATLNAREKLRALNRPPGSSFLSNLTFTDIQWARSASSNNMILTPNMPSHTQEVETDTHRNDIEMESFLQSKLSFRPVDSDCVVHAPEPAFLSSDRVV